MAIIIGDYSLIRSLLLQADWQLNSVNLLSIYFLEVPVLHAMHTSVICANSIQED